MSNLLLGSLWVLTCDASKPALAVYTLKATGDGAAAAATYERVSESALPPCVAELKVARDAQAEYGMLQLEDLVKVTDDAAPDGESRYGAVSRAAKGCALLSARGVVCMDADMFAPLLFLAMDRVCSSDATVYWERKRARIEQQEAAVVAGTVIKKAPIEAVEEENPVDTEGGAEAAAARGTAAAAAAAPKGNKSVLKRNRNKRKGKETEGGEGAAGPADGE